MLRIALVFGALSGVVIIAGMVVILGLGNDREYQGSEYLGYLIMILALTMIFFGVKRYRDNDLGGVIKFMPAFFTGLAIAVVASLAYVVTWEAYIGFTGYDFISEYTKATIDALRAKGVTGAALDAEIAKMETLKVNYANPLFRIPMTFMEIFPVGLVIALISAAILRNPRALPATA